MGILTCVSIVVAVTDSMLESALGEGFVVGLVILVRWLT
jgi:hypothetical protein